MGITHATVATGTDAGTGEIHKAEWNAGHLFTAAASVDPATTGLKPSALTSTSYVDVDATFLKATVSGTGPFYVWASMTISSITSGGRLRLNVAVDGTEVYAAAGLLISASGATYDEMSIVGASTGTLSSGSHTIAIRGKTDSGSTVTFDGQSTFLILGP